MELFLLKLFCVLWLLFGSFIFLTYIDLVRKAFFNGKVFRCFVFGFLCGPLVWVFSFIRLTMNVGRVSIYYILQEIPDDLGNKKSSKPTIEEIKQYAPPIEKEEPNG